MKVKFTKLAALLLAGVALFATGCTDYEVDIQKVDKKVDNLTTEVNGKIASLEQQIAGINATIATLETIANHDKDIKAVRDEMATLKTTLETEFNGKIDKAVADLTAEINKKVNQADYDADKAVIEKAIKDLNDALDAAKDRIKALEDAKFQDQIDAVKDRVTKCENLLAGDWKGKTVKETIDDLAKTVADLESNLNGKISALEVRVKANEDAIKEIKETTLPDLKKRVEALEAAKKLMEADIEALKTGKLDKATFDKYVEETALTISAMKTAIGDLTKLEGVAKDKTSLVDAINAVIAKFDDYVLVKEFEAFKKLAATKQELEEAKAELGGRIEVCEKLLKGDWGGKTVQEYINAKAKELQDQVDNIVKNLIPALDKRVAALEKSVNDVILPQIEFALDYEGGLQGYIDDADQLLQDQIDEIWAWVDEYLIPTLNEIFADIYDQLDLLNARVIEALSRIQSVQYVPDYDDLKITTNMSYVYQAEAAERPRVPSENETEDVTPVLFVDQPTQVTYQFLPAQYAQDVADGVEEFITDPSSWRFIMYLFGLADEVTDDPFTREELKELGISGILPFFDVRPVNTRDDDAPEAPQPAFVITSVDKVDTATGEITFTVQPLNVASAQYAANGIKPIKDLYMTDAVFDDYYYMLYWPVLTQDGESYQYTDVDWDRFVHYVYDYNDLKAYEDRAAFAAQLRMYAFQDFDENPYYEYDDEEEPYIDYENELASPYNVLYPKVSEIQILPDPYKKEEDGSVRPFLEDEVFQTLPYSALRKDGDNAIGEKPEQDPKGYRIILDQAVPVVSIDGGEPMSLEAAEKAGYHVPPITTEFKEFKYFDPDGAELAEEKKANFVETPKVYAEFEMNAEKPASSRKMEVGDHILGWYEFKSLLGAFPAFGSVEITKPQGTISANSNIVWTYSLDANVDHNLWVKDYKGTQAVETVEGGEVYNRTALAVNIVPEEAAELEKNLGVTIEDFRKATPVDGTLKITTTDETGAVVTVDTITFPGEYPVKIDADGNLTVDIAGFEWNKVYTVTANYELDAALITVTWTITTVDRNRDVITIELPEYAFDLNGEDYDADADTYTSKPQDFLEELFAAFVDQKIINQEEVKDYEAADDFKGDGTAGIGGKEGHLTRYFDEEGKIPETDSPYVICGDDYALFYKVTSEQLHEVWEAGEAQVRNVLTFIGQQVEIIWPVTVNIPNYDFLHLRYYTFNTKREAADFITKLDFTAKQAGKADVEWWSQVYPSYYTDQAAEGQAVDPDNRVSNRYALADYDVAYINLAELAFNVVDENDDPMTDEQIEEEKLVVKFDYTWENQGVKPLPTVDQLLKGNPVIENYEDLWMAPTTFYYRTNEYEFIPVNGTLAILSGNTEFEIKTRFQKNERNSVKHPSEALDYSSYAVVRWSPFKVPPTVNNIEIVLDENKVYYEPLFKGMNLMDNRPNGVSFPVIVDGEWVMGDAAEDATADSKSNGYIEGVRSDVAYHIDPVFDFSTVELPVDLQKLLTLKYFDGQQYIDAKDATPEQKKTLPPYIVFDYSSQIQFHGVVTVPISVVLENPWQEAIPFDYNLVIKGIGD